MKEPKEMTDEELENAIRTLDLKLEIYHPMYPALVEEYLKRKTHATR